MTAATGTAVAVAAVTGTLLFAVAVSEVVGEPERYGWGFDWAFLANYGYGDPQFDLGVVREELDRDEVESWGAVLLSGGFSVNGETVPSIGGREGFDAVIDDFPLLEGDLPSGDGELALGATTAEELGVEVGDRVTVAGFLGEREATVAGLVVLPDVGPFQSDRTSLAVGALLPGALVEATYAGSEELTGLTPSDLADSQIGAVLVDLAEGTDGHDLEAALGGGLDRFDPGGFGVSYPDPVRAPTIIDLAAVQGLPSILAGLFAVAMVAAVVAGLAAGTRARRQELGLVRALGATRRQRRASVRVQAVVTVGLGTLIGLPFGVALSRVGFRRMADEIGVADDVDPAVLLAVAVAVGALALALLAAEVLARRAVVRRPLPAVDPGR
jgi:putative ABC transport system permease protein